MSDAGTWVRAVEAAAVVANEGVHAAQAGRSAIVVYAVEGEFYATEEMCSHGQASLAEGWLEGHMIECPLHQGMFDVRTGAATAAPCSVPIRTYPTRVTDGWVMVQLQQEEPSF